MTEPLGQTPSSYEQHVRKWMADRRAQRCVTAVAAGAELELAMLDIIGEDWWSGEGITSKWVKNQLDANPSITLIRVLLDSPGGSVFDGVAIHNLLKRHAARVEVEVLGEASSAASVIAMAGDVIKMHEGTTMMVHRASACGCGFAEDFRSVADSLDTITGSLMDIYETRTGRARADVEAMVKKETWMSASDAVKEGFADEVVKAGSKPLPAKGKAKNAAGILVDDVAIRVDGSANGSDVASIVGDTVAAALENLSTVTSTAPMASSLGATPPPEQTIAPAGAPTNDAPAAHQEEDKTMSETMTTIRALLNLSAGTPDGDVIAAVGRLRDLERKAVEVTGATNTEAANGALDALKAKADRVDAMEPELAKIRADRDKQNFETLITQGQSHPVKLSPAAVTYWRDQFNAAVAEGKGEAGVERLRGFLSIAHPIPAFQSPVQPRAGAHSPAAGDAPMLYEGKSYEQLSYVERGRLKNDQPELHSMMKQDWESRGKPGKPEKAA
jgi:ATP-dependent Clp protease protease subunit